MRYRVIKTFATPGHRFHAGTEVEGGDIDGRITPERWVELGRLEAIGAPKKRVEPESTAAPPRAAPGQPAPARGAQP